MKMKNIKLAISVLAAVASALPLSAQETTGVLATYTYLDDGTKLSVSTPDGKGHVYRGSFVYDQTGTELQYVILPDGMFERVDSEDNESSQEYRSLWFVKDQVGSVVSVVDITDSNVSVDDAVVMETGYLPFGSELTSVNFV